MPQMRPLMKQHQPFLFLGQMQGQIDLWPEQAQNQCRGKALLLINPFFHQNSAGQFAPKGDPLPQGISQLYRYPSGPYQKEQQK